MLRSGVRTRVAGYRRVKPWGRLDSFPLRPLLSG
jgi:hypothetical protein